MKKNIIVLCGGNSEEHEVSLLSAENIISAIDKEKYNIDVFLLSKENEILYLNHNEVLQLNCDLNNNKAEKHLLDIQQKHNKNPNNILQLSDMLSVSDNTVVFPVIHGNFGEDGKLQSILETMNLPYIGSSVTASAICMDKDITKTIVSSMGISVAESIIVKEREEFPDFYSIKEKLGLPFFIKPARQGSSVGVSKISDSKEYKKSLNQAFKYDSKILIEESIEGIELECAILGNDNPIASSIGRIVLNEDEFYSYNNKYKDEKGTLLEIPANISEKLKVAIKEKAIHVYKKLECRGMARVDFFIENNEIIFNEINTVPGFTNLSMYPRLMEDSGINYSSLIDQLINLAIEDYHINRKHQSR